MAVPSQGTVAVGDKITASLWNDDVRDAVSFLTSPPRVKVYKTANQSIAYSTTAYTCLTWDAEVYDSDTLHNNTTSNSRITFTTAGTYQITLNCLWGAVSDATPGNRYHAIEKNGNTTFTSGSGVGINVIEPFAMPNTNATHQGTSITVNASFVAGDYIQAFVLQTRGAATALNLSGTSESHSTFSARWIAT